jgi:5-oxoprolinase (ATP-hydrolysing) subunit C
MTGLRLLDAGASVSIQDRGRPGWQRYGVPESGAMDWLSLGLANRLAGNMPGEAALEVAAPGLTVTPEGQPLTLAAAGPSVDAWLDGRAILGNRGYLLEPGQQLRLRPGRDAVFAYLAVAGGLALREVFGSRSFHARSGLGGTGSPLAAGTLLPVCGGRFAELQFTGAIPLSSGPVTVVEGPQREHVDEHGWQCFLGQSWRVDPRSDRMGIRLAGPPLDHSSRGYNIVSDGIALGSVQLPGNGQPIVLGADRQTTGGYPKIAVVARADMVRFVQRPHGQSVTFRICSEDDAVGRLRVLRHWIDTLQLHPAGDPLDSRRLLSLNLIDGVIRA